MMKASAQDIRLAAGLLLAAPVAVLAVLLAGCGGGGNDAETVPAAAPPPYNVEADAVKVAGGTVAASLESTAAIQVFKAIPYAAAPTGVLRWKPPQPVRSWTGTRRSNQFGPACMQGTASTFTSILYTESPSVSENCLMLNVWTPAADRGERHPVMVLIQGGSNRSGSASNPVYGGAGLAAKGAVVVTFNYRLGVFGWLAHPELSAESPNKVSGNYGLLDQLAALQWVKDNIAVFGGDPGNVTVFAQSAGAWNLNTLLASPLAKGLMNRAVLESGGTFPGVKGNARTLAQAERAGSDFVTRTAKVANIAALRAMAANDLQALVGSSFDTTQVVDGYVLPDQIDVLYRSGRALDVPILAGSNTDDNNVFPPGFATTLAGFQAAAQGAFGPYASQVQALYNVTDDASAAAVRFILPDDFELSWQPYTLARTMAARYTSKAYLYLFDRVPPYYADQVNYAEAADPVTLGAYHTLEQVYFYNNLSAFPRPYTDTDRRLSDITSTYLVNFATSGDPNMPVKTTAAGYDLPAWPAYSSGSGQLMRLGAQIAPIQQPHQAALDLFDGIFAARNGRPLAFQ